MMALIVTWPGILLGILFTVMIEALCLIFYAIFHGHGTNTKIMMEEIKDERK